MNKFEIPIDKSIVSFKEYIDYNDRCMLSAEFGDGKTYFLNKFKESYSNDYEFITLYPVNYQVEDNKDIFELIKRDILVQLTSQNMIKESYDISNSFIAYSYLINNKRDVFLDVLSGIADLNLDNTIISSFCSLITKTFGNLANKFADFKKEFNESTNTSVILQKYLTKFEDNSNVYDFDIITQIITDSIITHKEETNKANILIIEDLDRLDPEHTFRILNILSAHIDRQIFPTRELLCNKNIYNKFAFDKIIIVCDYDNIKKIYHHFYGNETKFEGYIAKFTSLKPFKYSLQQESINFFIEQINELTHVDKTIISKFIDYAKNNKILHNSLNARTIVGVLENLESQLRESNIKLFLDVNTRTDCGIFYFFIVLKRLGFTNNEIVQCAKFFDIGYNGIKCFNPFIIWGASYINVNLPSQQTFFIHSIERGEMEKISISNYTIENGYVTLTISHCGNYMQSHDQKFLSIENIISKVLSYIKD